MADGAIGSPAEGGGDGRASRASLVDSGYAWWRLFICLLISTIGGAGLWCIVVVIPEAEADFKVDRATSSLSYTACMTGFALGGLLAGRLVDRIGVFVPLVLAAVAVGAGFYAAAFSDTIWQFTIIHGLLIGVGASATFAPLMADISQCFVKRRGIAIAICASGNYLAGTVWPIVLRNLLETGDWRHAYIAIGSICAATMLPLALILIKRAPSEEEQERVAVASGRLPCRVEGEVPKGPVQGILVLAGIACCVAMSMPQVHIVAYCVELDYGVARGAEMLSLMLATGIISRLASGFIADRIGGVRTVILGSVPVSYTHLRAHETF